MVPGIVMLLVGILVVLDYRIIGSMPDLLIVAVIIIALYYMYKEQLFLLNARIVYKPVQLFQNAVRMMFAHPLISFVGAAFCLFPVLMFYMFTEWFFRLIPLWVMGWFSLGSWLTVKVGNKAYLMLFEIIGNSEDNNNEDNETDKSKAE